MATRLELSVSQYVGMLTSHYHRARPRPRRRLRRPASSSSSSSPAHTPDGFPLSGVEIAPRAALAQHFGTLETPLVELTRARSLSEKHMPRAFEDVADKYAGYEQVLVPRRPLGQQDHEAEVAHELGNRAAS